MTSLYYTLAPNSIRIEMDEDGEKFEYIDANDHRFERVRKALLADMVDPSLTLDDLPNLLDKHYRPEVEKLQRLSGRVSYDAEADVILFDNDPLDTTLAAYIRGLIAEDHPQVDAFVKFMEKLATNPSERSRNELFNWFKTLTDRGERMTIATNGNIVAYKGVREDEDGNPVSINAGPGIVNGVHFESAHLPNKVGSVVEVSRSYVDDNENIGCSRGLHAGTYSYAHGFAQGVLLRVEVDPADVVSVPKDCAYQKIRSCRYTVSEVIDAPETKPVVRSYYDAGWSDEDYAGWSEQGFHRSAAENYDREGVSFEDAIDLEESGDRYSVSDWTDLGFTLPQVVALKKAGVGYHAAADGDFADSILEGDADDEGDWDDDEDYCEYCGDMVDEDEPCCDEWADEYGSGWGEDEDSDEDGDYTLQKARDDFQRLKNKGR